MNKLVIIGNGFDLAHELPTSYSHFINYFWTNVKEYNSTGINNHFFYFDEFYEIFKHQTEPITCYADFKECLEKYVKNSSNTAVLYNHNHNIQINRRDNGKIIFQVKNIFLKIISELSSENWVDIENTYYLILKSFTNESGIRAHGYTKDIFELNREFDEIKMVFEEYLVNEIKNKFEFKQSPINENEILKLFNINHYNLERNREHKLFLEFPHEDHPELIAFDKNFAKYDWDNLRDLGDDFKLPEILFLDFNYTPTIYYYAEKINSNFTTYSNVDIIKIHGEISKTDNPINFGFGDEMDESYKIIENKNDNTFLQNIKSFQYLHNSNYRKLLNWIENDKFQVFICGHSCGLSDRTLLNTIFENKNCRSIKIFYYTKEKKDNYTEITHNISRHFKDKKVMRSKIVDKTLCTKLPQSVRFNNIKK